MEKKNTSLLIILGVLLIIGVGISFAYYFVSARVTGTGSNSMGKTSKPIEVIYDAGTGFIDASDLTPGKTATKNFKVTVSPGSKTNEATYVIKLDITENTFETCTTSPSNPCLENAEELTYTLKDSNNNIIKTGDLTNGVTGSIELERVTKTVTSSTDYNYTLEITFKDTNASQNHNQNKIINGTVIVEFGEKGKSIDDIVADATTTKDDFSTTATTDEGAFLADDPMYGSSAKTTYFRGAVTNNWVKFGGHFWRIIRKNGDGTLRLIYSGTTSGNDASAIPNVTIGGNGAIATGTGTQITVGGTNTFAYVTSNGSGNEFPAYVGWTYKTNLPRPTSSNNSGSGASADPNNASSAPNSSTEYRSTAYEQALAWFNSNISAADQAKVDAGKFCNDRMTESGENPTTGNTTSSFNSAASKRLYTNKTPTLECANLGDVYTTKVGLITADETSFAGGVWFIENHSYYLYTNQSSWMITPRAWFYSDEINRYANVFAIYSNGQITSTPVKSLYGIRPVINLKSDTKFLESGTGTYNNPYVVI